MYSFSLLFCFFVLFFWVSPNVHFVSFPFRHCFDVTGCCFTVSPCKWKKNISSMWDRRLETSSSTNRKILLTPRGQPDSPRLPSRGREQVATTSREMIIPTIPNVQRGLIVMAGLTRCQTRTSRKGSQGKCVLSLDDISSSFIYRNQKGISIHFYIKSERKVHWSMLSLKQSSARPHPLLTMHTTTPAFFSSSFMNLSIPKVCSTFGWFSLRIFYIKLLTIYQCINIIRYCSDVCYTLW